MDLKDVQKHWNAFGKIDPLWAILTFPDRKGNKWQRDEFFKTGLIEVNLVMKYVESLGQKIPCRKALDFGCGVGRLCSWLASRCSEVYGIDRGIEGLRLAAEYNARANIVYQAYDGETIPFSQSYFNAILCVGVLHKRVFPGEKLPRILGEFRRVLRTPGTIVAIEHVYGREQASD